MKRDDLPTELKPRIRPVRHIDGHAMYECIGQSAGYDAGWVYIGWDGKPKGRGDTPELAFKNWQENKQ